MGTISKNDSTRETRRKKSISVKPVEWVKIKMGRIKEG